MQQIHVEEIAFAASNGLKTNFGSKDIFFSFLHFARLEFFNDIALFALNQIRSNEHFS